MLFLNLPFSLFIDQVYVFFLLIRYLDYINLMSYDLNGSWSARTGHNSPLYPRSDEVGWDRRLNIVGIINELSIYSLFGGGGRKRCNIVVDRPSSWVNYYRV